MKCKRSRSISLQVVVLAGALLTTTVAFGQVPIPQTVQPPNPNREVPAHTLPTSMPDGFSVAAAGDLIVANPISSSRSPGFLSVQRLLQGADVTFGNLEESLIDLSKLRLWVAAETGGDDLNGPPSLVADFKAMGFDLLSRSNNHSTDWGIRGMEETDRVLDRAALVHAGTGRDLAAARAPGDLTTPEGRVALVSMTSSHTLMEPAGAPLRGVAGRPGANVLRTTRYRVVTTQQMGWLRNIYESQPDKPRHPANPDANQLKLALSRFVWLIFTHAPDGPGAATGSSASA